MYNFAKDTKVIRNSLLKIRVFERIHFRVDSPKICMKAWLGKPFRQNGLFGHNRCKKIIKIKIENRFKIFKKNKKNWNRKMLT